METDDVVYELLRFFEAIDTKKNWGLEPDEAVQTTLQYAENDLGEDTVDEYIGLVLEILEGEAYSRLGIESNFDYQSINKDKLKGIIQLSPFAQRRLYGNKVDLSNATEVELSDGRKISINPHLQKNN